MGQGRLHISFRVDIENKILCHEPGMSAVVFSSSWNFRWWKSVSLMEISRNPGNYLPMMLLFIHRHYVLNYRIFYDLCALSPQSLSAKSVFISYWLWKEMENFFMQITSHMTDGNQFLNRGISFSLRKPTRWKIYLRQPQNSLTLLSVKIAADQLIIRPSLFAESSLSNR